MEKRLDAQITSLFGTRVCLNKYGADWVGKDPFVKHETRLGVIQQDIILECVNAGLKSTGVSADKKLKFKEMVAKSLVVAGAVYDYASDKNYNELMKKVNITVSSFSILSELEKANLGSQIVAAANDSIGDMGTEYIISATDITDLATCVTNYRLFIPKPKAAIADAATARKNVEKLVKEGFSILKKVDKLMNIFANTDFSSEYFMSRKIVYASTANKIYTLDVACNIIRKICIHLFKIGETVTIYNDGTVSLQLGLALKAKSTVLVWYTVAAGATVTINPELLGNLTLKYIMVKNADLFVKGHLVFTINKAK